MKRSGAGIGRLSLVLAASALSAAIAFGQAAPQQQAPQPGQTPGQQQPNSANPNAPLTLDTLAPPVNAEEEAALKNFHDVTPQDADKKDQAAEEFVQKYPLSRHLPEVYNWMVRSAYTRGQIDKMEATADKELAIYPNDPQTLALVGTTLPRAMNASTPEPQKRLAKAEEYCQKALDILPTLPKPEGLTDENFQQVKGETSSMAYSGLGLVAFRRGKYADAISNLEKAVKADPQHSDPVDYYVLGIADEKTSHFDDAVAAFNKCAEIPGKMQTPCTQGADEAKKMGATQLSAPK